MFECKLEAPTSAPSTTSSSSLSVVSTGVVTNLDRSLPYTLSLSKCAQRLKDDQLLVTFSLGLGSCPIGQDLSQQQQQQEAFLKTCWKLSRGERLFEVQFAQNNEEGNRLLDDEENDSPDEQKVSWIRGDQLRLQIHFNCVSTDFQPFSGSDGKLLLHVKIASQSVAARGKVPEHFCCLVKLHEQGKAKRANSAAQLKHPEFVATINTVLKPYSDLEAILDLKSSTADCTKKDHFESPTSGQLQSTAKSRLNAHYFTPIVVVLLSILILYTPFMNHIEQIVHVKLAQNQVPIGFIYVQLPKESAPAEIWPGTRMKWKDVTSDYAGLFFRAEGGEAAPFGSSQEGNSPRLVGVQYGYANQSDLGSLAPVHRIPISKSGQSEWIFVGCHHGLFCDDAPNKGDRSCILEHLRFEMSKHSGEEVRPRNMAMRVWKRIK